MNIKTVSIVIATIMLASLTLLLLTPMIATGNTSNNTYTTPLLAGQYYEIGYVETWTESSDNSLILHVKYKITDLEWYLTEVHLAVATSLDNIPKTKTGNPIPGLFPYKAEELWTQSYEITINLTEMFELTCPTDDTTLYIAAHAVVAKVDEYGNIVQTETAWGQGTRFTNRGSWGMYFTYTVSCETTELEEVCTLYGYPETAWANGYDFGGNSWAMYVVYNSGTLETDLIRAQYYDVGNVSIWRYGDYLVVSIVLDEGYSLTLLHIHVATSLNGIPQTGNGNPKIGNFEYQTSFTGITPSFIVYIPLDATEQSATTLYVAIHAEVDTYTCTINY
uniref:Uncharacterized protein n=1 Tax=Ignisphaera aggregans TaxID=334771 RepID=A0A7C5XJE1_9CREN